MLWLFGGANVVGSANNPTFDGAALARQGVLVVTANFRVGAMGFLAHPALAAESEHRSSGNYMLLDQIAVLRWINENIAQFGGDPRNVTVFGQSSGSYDLLLLMTSPLARGLFHKAIAQSGNFLAYGGPMPRARAEQIGLNIASDLKATDAAALRALPAGVVIAASQKWMPTQPGTNTGLLTSIDGYVLRSDPASFWAAGRQAAVPLIIGNNAREISREIAPADLRDQITALYGDLAPQAFAAYGLSNGGVGLSDPLLGSVGSQWWTDIVQRCPASLEAAWHAKAGHPAWRYQFERSLPGREAQGAYHSAEVPFVWGNLELAGVDRPAFKQVDYDAARQMQRYWANFARTGDPNGPGLPRWHRADGGRYLAFTQVGPVDRVNLQPDACAVYRAWIERRLR